MVENCTEEEVIAQLTPYRRVLAGDDLQWIVQDLTGGRWRNIAYCRWRDTILERFIPVDADLHVVGSLKALPVLKGGNLQVDARPATPDSRMTVEEITTVDAPTVLFGGPALRGDDSSNTTLMATPNCQPVLTEGTSPRSRKRHDSIADLAPLESMSRVAFAVYS
jgi:hypothetical protein